MASRSDRWAPGCCPHLRFYGRRISHCAACHETFAGPSAFDAHKLMECCKDPRECGMEQRDTGVWHWPPRESLIRWLATV